MRSGGPYCRIAIAVFSGLLCVCSFSLAHATVYGWKSNGALYFSNDPENVPEAHRDTAQQFTSKLAGKSAPVKVETPPPPRPEVDQLRTYERGLERGLKAAERQVALAGELARSVLAAVPARPPVRVIVQQPEPIIRYVSPDSAYPSYGFIGPYAPHFNYGYGSHYAYGFGRGRFVPHSHFFPGRRGGHRGIFFPHGHFSRDGFLFGHGLVVR